MSYAKSKTLQWGMGLLLLAVVALGIQLLRLDTAFAISAFSPGTGTGTGTATGGNIPISDARRIASLLDPDLMHQLPSSFLPEYKTPCWHIKRQSTGDSSATVAAAVISASELKQQQQQQLLLPAELFDVQCLPYFHILGGFQSGAFSLYSMLAQHPEVAKGHNPRPHFWSEHDKPFSSYMSELQGALPFIRQQPGKAVLGDASESTFAFYMAAGLRGHRLWLQTVQPCHARCEQLQEPFRGRCLEVCWENATAVDTKAAASFGLPRWQLDTPFFMRAAYGTTGADSAAARAGAGAAGADTAAARASAGAAGAAVPKLIVLLREPTQRLLSAFREYGHYKSRYGDSAEGFLAFVREQVSAFQNCSSAGHRLVECVLLFESLSYRNEQVFFHCDQVLRGIYWVYLASWQRHFGTSQLLILLSEELFAAPKVALQRVVNFLGLTEAPDEVLNTMLQAAGHRESLTVKHADVMLLEAQQLVDSFYEPHNKRLGAMLNGKAESPWARLHAV